MTKSDRCQQRADRTSTAFREEQTKIACKRPLNPVGTGRFPLLVGHPKRTRADAIGNRWCRVQSLLSRACAPLPEPSYWPLRPLFLTSSYKGRQYDHDRSGTRKRNAHGSGVVKLFLFFDRRPSFLTKGDVSSRLLCENPVVRDKNFRLVTSLALKSTALGHWAARQRRRRRQALPRIRRLRCCASGPSNELFAGRGVQKQ